MSKIKLTFEPEYKGPLYDTMGSPKFSIKVFAEKEQEFIEAMKRVNSDWKLVKRTPVNEESDNG